MLKSRPTRVSDSAKRLCGAASIALLLFSAAPVAAAEPRSSGAAQAPGKTSDIVLQGKLVCPLKRNVIPPFRGIVTAVNARAGQSVKEGEVLAQYRLRPEVIVELRRRLSPPQITELETRIAEVDKGLAALESRRRELKQLSLEKFAPEQSVKQVEREIQAAYKHRNAVEARMKVERQLARDDLAVLKEQLGKTVGPNNLPEQVSLQAPISGYVIAVSSDLREGAEIGPGPPAFIVGVMDPMVMKAQVHEMEAVHVALGDEAGISLESIPGKTFKGTVSRVSWTPLTPGLEQPSYYEVELSLPNPDLTFKEGLKGQIAFRKSK